MRFIALLPPAQVITRTFEWGRIQSNADWILPVLVFAALTAFVCYTYRRDSVELPRWVGSLLAGLRVLAFVGLAILWLAPQWRTERELVQHSRVLVLVDTSLSMGLTDADGGSVVTGPSRAEQVVAVLKDEIVERLRRKHDVSMMRFDQNLGPIVTLAKRPASVDESRDGRPDANPAGPPADAVGWAAALAPRGTETRLGQALRDAIQQERAAPLAGIVVFSDGGNNVGIDPDAAIALAREAKVPVFPVGIGSPMPPTNVRVADLMAPARAFPGDHFTVTGLIQSQGFVGKSVTAELFSRPATGRPPTDAASLVDLEATQEIVLGGDGEVVPVKIELNPSQTGRRTFVLRVRPPAGDQNSTDNQHEADIEIVDRKTRVLLVAGGPARDYRFLANQLHRDKYAVVDVLLQSARPDISQDASRILDEFPRSREELYEYDAIVAFDPNWLDFDQTQIDLLEQWVAEQAGGLIVVAGPVYTGAWTQHDAAAKIRDLYPVQFHKRLMLIDEGRYSSKEPWPIELTREGLEAEFLRLADTSTASQQAWSGFQGIFGYYPVRGPKPAATVYARFSDPRAGDGGLQPVYFAGQFYGSGRVFYLGSGEMWRIRAESETYFERFYTQLIRHVSQGRLLRGSARGVLLIERDRYLLGDTVTVRAQLSGARLEPLTQPSVTLTVLAPDGTSQSVTLAADPTRPGAYTGQFAVRHEGTYRLELPLPESDDERLARPIQVRVPDLERENPQLNRPLLAALAAGTGGKYFEGPQAAVAVCGELPDRTRTTVVPLAPITLWDNKWLMIAICALLCLEWLIRKLARLA